MLAVVVLAVVVFVRRAKIEPEATDTIEPAPAA